MIDLDFTLVDPMGKPVGNAVVMVTAAPTPLLPSTRFVNPGGPGTCNFYHGAPLTFPLRIDVTVIAAGYAPWTTGGDPLSFQSTSVNKVITLQPFKLPFQPAPRRWKGNMCGVEVEGLPPVAGGASNPNLVVSWFYDRYNDSDRAKIRQAWDDRGDVDVLLSWPDSRAAGATPEQFQAMCRELIAAGKYPCPMLTSKDFDPADVPAILAELEPVIELLIGVVPRVCIGWELSIWLSPTQVQELIDAIAPRFVAADCKVYVHFQQGYFAFQQPGHDTASFWWLQVGKLTGILHQRDLSWADPSEYQARIVDCLQRFAGGFNFPADSGFGHAFDFIALEITAQPMFNGDIDQATQNHWGTIALTTPPSYGVFGDVPVMGSGNGEE